MSKAKSRKSKFGCLRHVGMRILQISPLLACIILLASCGSKSDAGPTAIIDQTRAPWQVLDLDTGTVTPQASLPDLATDLRFRERLMAFRLVPNTSTLIGQSPGTFARQSDEVLFSVQAACYIGAFEITRAQWRRLSAVTPWTAPAIAAVDGTGGSETLPATGLGHSLVAMTLANWNSSHPARLAMPSPAQWEIAARGGNGAIYPWGGDHRTSTVRRYAVTWETGLLDATSGPQPVGTRLANGLGLYDFIGNAWELTSDGQARGGSWADSSAFARPANQRDVPDDGWATVGARLIYLP